MKVRSQLVFSFVYILLTVILALGLPLAVTLRNRTLEEFKTALLLRAQDVAARIGGEAIVDPDRAGLQAALRRSATRPGERIILVAADGTLIGDSAGSDELGGDYATVGRPEISEALAGLGQPNTDVRFSDDLGQDIVVAAAPILGEAGSGNDPAEVLGAVRLTEPIGELQAEIRATTLRLALICSVALLVGLLLAFALAGRLAGPLGRLTAAARRLGRGDLDARVGDVGAGGEVGDLAHSFDDMADRTQRTVQAQREFVANASHQLRTPLTGMKLRLESAIEATREEDLRRQLVAADREVDRLAEIVERLLVMSKQIEAGEPTQADVDQAVERAAERWRDRAERGGSSLSTDGSGGTVQANPADLDQILDNLLENAIRYAPGSISIDAERRDSRTMLAVQDHGPGVPADELARLTDRFSRGASAPPGGSGLGLAIARELAEKWGATATLSSPEGGGLRVEILFRALRGDDIS